jgi:hypothetical protein
MILPFPLYDGSRDSLAVVEIKLMGGWRRKLGSITSRGKKRFISSQIVNMYSLAHPLSYSLGIWAGRVFLPG